MVASNWNPVAPKSEPHTEAARRTLVATYRLQVFPDLSLERALETLDYLAELGVSHVYFSPYFSAHPGSTHGYDVVDFSRIHEGWGEAGHARLCLELERRGLCQVIDIVPNHMGIRGRENVWWSDVLEKGEASAYFRHFDIDLSLDSDRKLVLAILPAPLDQLVHAGRVRVEAGADGRAFLDTPSQALPLSSHARQRLTSAASPCDPELLLALLADEHYRLLDYRSGRGLVNYRRYLDVNELGALRMDDEAVFDEVHARVLDWVERGLVAGIRVDHPDGLADPTDYFRRLRALAPKAWIVAEKVLEPGHSLPAGWPVDGTTGYEFMNLSFGLFVDPRGLQSLEAAWPKLTGAEPIAFSALANQAKREVLNELFAAELTRLTRVAESAVSIDDRELERIELRSALAELLVAMPHGRTHRSRGELPTVEERTQLRTALARAVEDRPDLASALSALEKVLSGSLREEPAWELCQRFQQLTAAVSAKGVEDTAFYRFGPLISLCDLGSNPEQATFASADFHAHCRQVASERPRTLNTTSTHDTKRGEDARLRIAALSELPDAFIAAVQRWRAWLEPELDAPMVYHLFQTLIGVWPISRERIMQYALKAARETKRFTSWTQPNPEYEASLHAFLARIYDSAGFVRDLQTFLVPVRELAGVHSLAQVLLKVTAPGVPDIYQGSELWELHLVDPDNRRSVDFKMRSRLLRELSLCRASDFAKGDERAKLWLLRRALECRAGLPECFNEQGSYRGLQTAGAFAEHVVAFARGERVVTVVPRLAARAADGWLDTRVLLPRGQWRNALTQQTWQRGELHCSELFSEFPVALLTREG